MAEVSKGTVLVEIKPELVGMKPASESVTVKATRWAQAIALLGSLFSMFFAFLPQVQDMLLPAVPITWQPVVIAAFQLLAAVGSIFMGQKAIAGRVAATERVYVTKK